MKSTPRATATRVVSKRITAPETRIDRKTGKKVPLLSYIDAGSYQQHADTSKDLFLYAAGSTEPGEVSDGLDRLFHHKFTVHLDDAGKAVGIDVIPSRLYRSDVQPVSQKDVKTITVQYLVGGAVAKVVKRPFNVRYEQSAAVIKELDKLIAAGKDIAAPMRLGNIGKVVSATEYEVEVKLNASTAQRNQPDDFVSDLEDDDAEAEVETEATA